MKQVSISIGTIVGVGVLLWFFPLFHVVAVEKSKQIRANEFDAAEFVKSFWAVKLVPSFDQAADVSEVLKAIRDSPNEARQRFARSAGLGRATLYFVRGGGTVAAIDERGAGVRLGQNGESPEVLLQTGLVTGNTARDATGLLFASDYLNSQQFNEISTALNRVVETTVTPQLKRAKVGDRIEFVGSARVLDLPSDVQPLEVIPFDVRLE